MRNKGGFRRTTQCTAQEYRGNEELDESVQRLLSCVFSMIVSATWTINLIIYVLLHATTESSKREYGPDPKSDPGQSIEPPSTPHS